MAKSEKRDPGMEYLDTTPVEVPLRFRNNPGEVDRIRRLVRDVMSEVAAEGGAETFEEANDFEVEDDDGLPYSPHEVADDDAEFGRFAKDASLDDSGKKEYVARRSRRHSGGERERGDENGNSKQTRSGDSGKQGGVAGGGSAESRQRGASHAEGVESGDSRRDGEGDQSSE